MNQQTILSGVIVEEEEEFTLTELSHTCGVTTEWLLALVEEGVIEPVEKDAEHLRFRGVAMRRVRIVQRLQNDLDINIAGAALAVDLLEEVEDLRNRIAVLERLTS